MTCADAQIRTEYVVVLSVLSQYQKREKENPYLRELQRLDNPNTLEARCFWFAAANAAELFFG